MRQNFGRINVFPRDNFFLGAQRIVFIMPVSCTWLLLLFVFLVQYGELCVAQEQTITFEFNTTSGLVYFLVIFFFMFNFGTPIARYIYVNYLMQLVERASKEMNKISKRLSDRISDAGRKVSQQMRQ